MEWLRLAVASLAGAAGTVWLAVRGFFALQGDSDIRIEPAPGSQPRVCAVPGGYEVRWALVLRNTGRQKGMFLDLLCRAEYLGIPYGQLRVIPRVRWPHRPDENYSTAHLLAVGEEVPFELMVEVRGSRAALQRLRSQGGLPMVLYYPVVSRTGMHLRVLDLRAQLPAQGKGAGSIPIPGLSYP